MSCIQLSEKHISAVAHGLAFILNGAGGMDHLTPRRTPQQGRTVKQPRPSPQGPHENRKPYQGE